MSERAAFCDSQQGVKAIASELNKGHGDTAKSILNECTLSRVAADPEQHKAWSAMHDQSKPTEERFKALEQDAAATAKVELKLWNSVIKAQGKDSSAQLCKLELTTDKDGTVTPHINKSATCHVTEYTWDKSGNLVAIPDKPH